MTLTETDQAKYRLLQKLASYAKIAKEELKTTYEYLLTGNDRVESSYFSLNFDLYKPIVYWLPLSLSSALNFNNLSDFDKLRKQEIYERYQTALEDTNHRDVVISVALSGNLLWVFYRTNQQPYEGLGGLVVRDSKCNNYYVFEPIDNFLKFNYPRPEE